MEIAFHLLASTCLFATEMKFSKYSVVSIISNWLYNSERKPGNAGNYHFFEEVDFHFQALKDFVSICQSNDDKTFNFNIAQI